jgi:hypothetical protein
VPKTLAIALFAASLGLALAPTMASAQPSWLDAPLQPWNSPGMAISAAPPPAYPVDPDCPPRSQRPPETPQDQQVAAAGWTLFAAYRGGWGINIVAGHVGYDGMCRPWLFQEFVFVDGAFAGTISPGAMLAREDGAGRLEAPFNGSGTLTATFARYKPSDPRCCPWAQTQVEYRIDRTPGGPVLVPLSATTTPSPPS